MTNQASSFPATPQIPPMHRYGGTVASNSEIAIHALGDVYLVEGSGTVQRLPGWPKGPPVLFHILANPTFVNSSKLLMPGGQNYTCSPGDTVTLLPLGDGAWRAISIDVAALDPGAAGWRNKQTTAKTAAYSVVTGDAGSTLNVGNNAFFELTFGAASSYPSNFTVMIRNTDSYSGIGTGRGKRINLNGTKFILYPGQNVTVFNGDGSSWDRFPKNQRWVQGVVSACVDTGGGAIGTVDGLAAGAGAFSQLQDAASFIWYGVDMAGSSATIAPTAGQTFLQTLSLGGQPVGSNVVFLKGNGGQATVQGTNGSDTISVGDNAELIIQDIYVRSSNNTLGKAGLKMHGNGVIDAFSGVTIEGGGVNDVGVFVDNGPGVFSNFNTVTFTNTFNSLIWSDRGGNLSIGALITNTGAGTMAVSKIMTLKGPGYTSIGTQITTTNWGSPAASPVSLGHVLNLNGTSMPGGTAVTSPGVVVP